MNKLAASTQGLQNVVQKLKTCCALSALLMAAFKSSSFHLKISSAFVRTKTAKKIAKGENSFSHRLTPID